MNTVAMNAAGPTSLLRRALLADVVVTSAAGLLLTLAAGPLGNLFDLPALLLRFSGLFLLSYTGVVLFVATRAGVRCRGVWAIVGLNLLWAASSLLLLVTGWVNPSALGVAFVAGQALIVAGFAEVQLIGLRRAND